MTQQLQFFGKRPFYDPRRLPKKFFEAFVPWLTDSTRPLERGMQRARVRAGPTPTEELFALIRSAAALFAADLEVGEGPAAALRGDCERALHEALRLRLGAATEAEAEGEGEGEAGRTYELSVVVCDDGFIRELNRTWRGVDAATDVLAFPAEAAFPGVPLVPLGDLVVSAETARRQAAAQGGGAGAVLGELR